MIHTYIQTYKQDSIKYCTGRRSSSVRVSAEMPGDVVVKIVIIMRHLYCDAK